MSSKNTSLSFTENMAGYVFEGTKNPKKGEKKGKANNNTISFDARIAVENVGKFINESNHEARLEGVLNYPPFGSAMKIEDGKFTLFVIDKDSDTKEMIYKFNFTSQTTGKRYYLYGVKEIERKLWDILDPLDPIKDMTTLFTTIYEGDSEKGPIVAAGILRFKLTELPELISSMQAEAPSKAGKRKAVLDFFGFALGELAETYLPLLFSRYMEMDEEYDAVVIGSGFGGSTTAFKLAEKGKSVCLLERGKRWRGKVDVKNLFDLIPMFRTPLNNGVFDYKISRDIHVLQANGVGGGSLIYASVLMRPDKDTFDNDWPDEINLDGLKKHFKHVEEMLEARKSVEPPYMFPKTEALRKSAESIGEGEFKLADIAVQDYDKINNLGKCDNLETEPSLCRACGNCVLVCNRSAKKHT